ncbi:MAG: serine O-acetyltransferase, partial [Burkholderiales bacterium]|nr:serine O-acetyltransferase [Burkholderiales bacterium]
GNPAHILKSQDQEAKPDAQVFSAYGVTANGDDPISKAFRQLTEHVCSQQEQIEQLREAIGVAGITCEKALNQKRIDAEEITQLVD